ncbi:non-homologous end-joining DNA ligase [Streptomyces kunmingensis]|uniref:Non-homologous end-joining DNA ligase n=1 Tax=Streptomyces kunmingensis TaxID=68225 RepID=A0ABU6CBH5_9ACTN|nr:non-homologous end-joining DNA ligase [Streptomyces kunmingensis]MEB3961532.1 non-homologous end-joining DNA ligase [Streptomyces kunmingensis]
MSSDVEVRIGRRTVEVKRADKELFPRDGLTKADLVEHYRRVAPRMLPELRGRPLMLERMPDGIDKQRFYQKEVSDYFPDWIHRAAVPKEGGEVTHVVCDDEATLVYLAGQACITPHRWLSRADRPRHPDRLVFDLDPPADDFEPVRRAAHHLHELLGELDLASGLMTTGSRGLHVVVPLNRRDDADDVLAFARAAAAKLAARHPDELTTEVRKDARKGRLYLDVARNGYAQTVVAPFAVRSRPGAPVAVPLGWDELDVPELSARRWTVNDLGDRLDTDPWAGLARHGRGVSAAEKRLRDLEPR